jgi:hypothetical protein
MCIWVRTEVHQRFLWCTFGLNNDSLTRLRLRAQAWYGFQNNNNNLFKIYLLWPMPLFLLFNTQTMHIKSFYTQQHCYVSLKTLYPGGIRTRVFLFLRRMRCPLRHAARAFRIISCCCVPWRRGLEVSSPHATEVTGAMGSWDRIPPGFRVVAFIVEKIPSCCTRVCNGDFFTL